MLSGQKYSRKREAILSALRGTKEHPSAETLYSSLKKELPDLSLGTVYRNLSLFRDEGVVRRVCTVDGQDRFDADMSEHPHFVCTVCGRVSDISVGTGIELSQISTLNGVEAERMDVIVYGRCAACK